MLDGGFATCVLLPYGTQSKTQLQFLMLDAANLSKTELEVAYVRLDSYGLASLLNKE